MANNELGKPLASMLPLLSPYIYSFLELQSLLSTSKGVKSIVLANIPPPTLFAIIYRSRELPSLSPSWYLVSLLALGISEWILERDENRVSFNRACVSGPDGILDLISRTPSIPILAKLDLFKLAAAYERKQRVLNPLTDLVDMCIGTKWSSRPAFWDRDDAVTLYATPSETLFQLVTYGELFGRGVKAYYRSVLGLDEDQCASKGSSQEDGAAIRTEHASLDDWQVPSHLQVIGISTRMEYIKYCLPDCNISSPHRPQPRAGFGLTSSYPPSPTLDPPEEVPPPTLFVPPRPEYDQTEGGPTYFPAIHPLRRINSHGAYATPDTLGRAEHSTALKHLLQRAPTWARVTQRVRQKAVRKLRKRTDKVGLRAPSSAAVREDLEFDETSYDVTRSHEQRGANWRQRLWEDALWTLGWDGLELIAQEWEEDEANAVARAQRQTGEEARCSVETREESPSFVSEQNERSLDRLGDLYQLIAALEKEPRSITIRPERRPYRSSGPSYTFPFLLGDLGLAVYNP